MMDTIYFDNNATTAVSREVFEEMKPYFCEYYGNPSSMHSFGGNVSKKIAQARQRVARLVGCEEEEIIFTSGGTESDNAAIVGSAAAFKGRKKIITSGVEHQAVLEACRGLESRGYEIVEIGVDSKGRLDAAELKDQLDDNTAVVSIMHANNETGTIFEIEKIAEMVTSKGINFHTDAVQAVGKLGLDLSKSCVSMLSLSGHKLHGPKGVGVLYVRKGTRFSPFMRGGHQEGGRRAGTENVPGIIGLGKACEMAGKNLRKEKTYVKGLRDRLEKGLLERCEDCFVNGDVENRLVNTSNISFEYIEGESILMMLDSCGICASSGSACTSGSLEPSHVLRAMGVPFTAAHGSIRFSLSVYNTEAEVDYALEKVPQIISRLREMSPFVKS